MPKCVITLHYTNRTTFIEKTWSFIELFSSFNVLHFIKIHKGGNKKWIFGNGFFMWSCADMRNSRRVKQVAYVHLFSLWKCRFLSFWMNLLKFQHFYIVLESWQAEAEKSLCRSLLHWLLQLFARLRNSFWESISF